MHATGRLAWIRLEHGEITERYSCLPLTASRRCISPKITIDIHYCSCESVCGLNSEPARDIVQFVDRDKRGRPVSSTVSEPLRRTGQRSAVPVHGHHAGRENVGALRESAGVDAVTHGVAGAREHAVAGGGGGIGLRAVDGGERPGGRRGGLCAGGRGGGDQVGALCARHTTRNKQRNSATPSSSSSSRIERTLLCAASSHTSREHSSCHRALLP